MAARTQHVTPARHHVTRLLPPPCRAERMALRSSLQQEGLRSALVISDGKLIDGYTRLSLCQRLAITPRFEEVGMLTDVEALLVFLTLNSERLDSLTPPQRAAWAARAMPLFSAEGKTAQQAGGRKGGQSSKMRREIAAAEEQPHPLPDDGATNVVGRAAQKAARNIMSDTPAPTARTRVAQAFRVSSGYVGIAKEVGEIAPGLLDQVAAGTISLDEARQHAKRLANDRRHTVEASGYNAMLRLAPDGRTVASIALEFSDPRDAVHVLAQLDGNPLVTRVRPAAADNARATGRNTSDQSG